jgi:glutathione S-transferase
MVLAMNVGRLRGKHRIMAPAMAGHPEFECAYRTQANTIERMAIALPALWVYALFLSPAWAAGAGVVWVLGRIVYAIGYMRDPEKRTWGMGITFVAEVWLVGGACYGAVRGLMV